MAARLGSPPPGGTVTTQAATEVQYIMIEAPEG